MPAPILQRGELRVGRWFGVSFQRTLRVPDDGQAYPLPPGLGRLPVFAAARFAKRVPLAWREAGDFFLPLRQGEALWLAFGGREWHPCALQVGAGGVNVLTGRPMDGRLRTKPQDYLVTPFQPWLDGIKGAKGSIRQFVAVPLGRGHTIEAQVSGSETVGGLQFCVHEAQPNRFPDRAPRAREEEGLLSTRPQAAAGHAMGLGAGGRLQQKVYPDPHGIDSWDPEPAASFSVHLVNSESFREITGLEPPPSPVDAAAYTARGLPWFEFYDEDRTALSSTKTLAGVKGIRELEGKPTETSVKIKRAHIRPTRRAPGPGKRRGKGA